MTFADLRIWTRTDPPHFIDFDLNLIQRLTLDTITEQQDGHNPWEWKGLRTNTVKARQQGISTFWLAVWYQMFYNLDYSQTILMAHRAESTDRLWQTVQTWESDCRRRLDLPKLRYSSGRKLVRDDTGSAILIATAGMEDIATSGLITNVHRSEIGLWKPGSEEQIVGILGALPEWGNLIDESTARGYGTHKDRWDAQIDRHTAFFFPFTDSDEYRTQIPVDFVRTEEERQMYSVRILGGKREEFQVSDEAVYWRRRKHQAYTEEGKPEATPQEFPRTPTEAFSATADAAYYPSEYILALLDEFSVYEPIKVIKPGEEGFGATIRIYELPEDGEEYTIGGDEAEGFTNESEHDDSAAVGFNIKTRRQVFSYLGRPDGVHFAHDLDGLSGYYNNAIVIPERVPMGGTLTNKLIDLGVNLYRHNTGKEDAPEHTKYGFPAHAKLLRDGCLKGLLCRAAMIWQAHRNEGWSASFAATEAGCPVIVDKIGLRQLLHYSNLRSGKRGGVGDRDDHNTAISLAAWWMETWAGGDYYVPERHDAENPLMRARRV